MSHKPTRLALVPFVVLLLSLALAAGLGLGRVSPARANPDTRYVAPPPTGNDSGDCTVVIAPCRTLGYAISQAADGDEIVIAAGTYTETLDVDGMILTFTGAGQAGTFVDGGGAGRVFYVRGGSVVTISGVTIQNGYAGSGSGGGVYSFGSTLTLIHVTVYSNTTNTYGGGLANSAGTMTLIDTTVVSNTCGGYGGGIRNMSGGTLILVNSGVFSNAASISGGGIYNHSLMTMTNSSVAGNRADGSSSYGGGLFNAGSATLIDSTFARNEVPDGSGGAIFNSGGSLHVGGGSIAGNHAGNDTDDDGGGVGSGSGLDATLVGVTIERNTSSGQGGGIYAVQTPLTLEASTIYSNSSVTDGGGLYVGNSPVVVANTAVLSNTSGGWGAGLNFFTWVTATIENSLVVGNSAHGEGGGIFVGGTGSTLVLTNATVSGNSTWVYGGGIESRAPMTVVNCTIVDNTADSDNNGSGDGGGVYNYDDGLTTAVAYYRNTILANNVDMGGQAPDCYNANGATSNSLGHNLVENSHNCVFGAGGDITGQDPLLGPLADNGGDTWTHALLDGGPAFNAGDDVGCPLTDQRGYRRVPVCDIGAYERSLQAFLPLVVRSY